MKDLERAKQFQQKLYSAIGKEWQEAYFHDDWYVGPYSVDWQQWHSMGLLPASHCLICGEDDVALLTHITHNTTGYKIPLCMECHNKKTEAQRKSDPHFGQPKTTMKGTVLSFVVLLSMLALWRYVFLREAELVWAAPTLSILIMNWTGLTLVHRWSRMADAPKYWTFYNIAMIVWSFFGSWKLGLFAIVSCIGTYFLFAFALPLLTVKRYTQKELDQMSAYYKNLPKD